MKFHVLLLGLIFLKTLSFAYVPPGNHLEEPNSSKNENWEITPSANPVVSGSVDFFITAEFLYMYASSTNLDWAQKGETIPNGDQSFPGVIFVPKNLESFETRWDPGGRIGAGITMSHDGWDLYANWTFFYNRINESIKVAPFPNNNLFTEPDIEIISLDNWLSSDVFTQFDRASAFWAFRLNQIDVELGRNFFISNWLSVRPYGGLRGAWTDNRLRVRGSFDSSENGSTEQFRSSFSQDFWGVGLLAGIQSSWFFVKNWSLWGNADTALIYGRYDLDHNSTVFGTDSLAEIDENFQFKTTSDFYAMQPIIDLSIGLRWQNFFRQDKYRILFDLGWETHIWLKHLAFFKFFGQARGDLREDQVQGDVSFNGLIFRGRFDF